MSAFLTALMATPFWSSFLGTGAALGIAKIVVDLRRDWQTRSDARQFAAIKLAFALEDYAVDCAQAASDHADAVEHDNHVGARLKTVPKPPPDPESDAWKYLDRKLLNDILDLPQRAKMAGIDAFFLWYMVGDAESTDVALERNTIFMGAAALKTAKAIRTTYKLEPRNMTFAKWNIDEHFAKKLAEFAADDARQAETKVRLAKAKTDRTEPLF